MEEQSLSSENNMQEQQIVNPEKRKPGRPPKDKSTSVQSTTQLEAIYIKESEKDNTNNVDNINNPKDNPDIKALMSTIDALKQQNEKLIKIVETVNITTTKPLITCSDEDINNLYLNYITNKETILNNAIIAEVDDKIIIPKSYYVIG